MRVGVPYDLAIKTPYLMMEDRTTDQVGLARFVAAHKRSLRLLDAGRRLPGPRHITHRLLRSRPDLQGLWHWQSNRDHLRRSDTKTEDT